MRKARKGPLCWTSNWIRFDFKDKNKQAICLFTKDKFIHFRYGDIHPQSGPGYFVGAVCTIAGMLATGLPIPIIASNFNHYYSFARYFLWKFSSILITIFRNIYCEKCAMSCDIMIPFQIQSETKTTKHKKERKRSPFECVSFAKGGVLSNNEKSRQFLYHVWNSSDH